jgi:ribosomal protein S6--L-glutamate ligase
MSVARIGILGLQSGWSSRTLFDAFQRLGSAALLLDPEKLVFDGVKRTVRHEDRDLSALQAIVVKKLGGRDQGAAQARLHCLRFLEKRGVVVFPALDEIECTIDRVCNTVFLRDNGIPMPPTLITEDWLEGAAFAYGIGDAILKMTYSSQARGQIRYQGLSREQLEVELEAKLVQGYEPLYLQKFVPTDGGDFGVYALEGELFGAYRRVAAKGNWVTSIGAGGKYEKADLPPEALKLALRTASLFKSGFVGVDVAESPQGFIVYEVSLFGGFRGMTEVGCADPAENYAKYALKVLREKPGR